MAQLTPFAWFLLNYVEMPTFLLVRTHVMEVQEGSYPLTASVATRLTGPSFHMWPFAKAALVLTEESLFNPTFL